MNKYIACIISVTALILSTAAVCRAQEQADASASVKTVDGLNSGFDYRVENLRNFLTKFNSPLIPYAKEFVDTADTYGLDYRLVPSITGVESTFGKQIPAKSFNAYGWANGNYTFKSWPDSIEIVSGTLRTKYIDKGAPTIAKIAKKYAPPSTTWATKVTYFVGKIDALPVSFDI